MVGYGPSLTSSSKVSRGSQYLTLLEALARNRRLTDINLSWNTLLGEAPKPLIAAPDAERQEEAKREHEERIASLLSNIVRCNKRLQHFNLENTGLTMTMMRIL